MAQGSGMHVHISGLTIVYVFVGVLIVGTFWRIGAAWATTKPGLIGELGKAAAVQF
jgi:hypothetical protein